MSHQRKSKIVTPKDEWETPQWLFDLLDQEFHFNCDAAANRGNPKCDNYFGPFPPMDSLKIDWVDPTPNHIWLPKVFYLNPPYSAGNIDKFMQKAYEESLKGAIVVCLVPCATDTRWWHNHAMKAQEIRFIKGRIRFVGYDDESKQIANSPTFSSCVVIFDKSRWRVSDIPGQIIADIPRIGPTIERPRKVKM